MEIISGGDMDGFSYKVPLVRLMVAATCRLLNLPLSKKRFLFCKNVQK